MENDNTDNNTQVTNSLLKSFLAEKNNIKPFYKKKKSFWNNLFKQD